MAASWLWLDEGERTCVAVETGQSRARCQRVPFLSALLPPSDPRQPRGSDPVATVVVGTSERSREVVSFTPRCVLTCGSEVVSSHLAPAFFIILSVCCFAGMMLFIQSPPPSSQTVKIAMVGHWQWLLTLGLMTLPASCSVNSYSKTQKTSDGHDLTLLCPQTSHGRVLVPPACICRPLGVHGPAAHRVSGLQEKRPFGSVRWCLKSCRLLFVLTSCVWWLDALYRRTLTNTFHKSQFTADLFFYLFGLWVKVWNIKI